MHEPVEQRRLLFVIGREHIGEFVAGFGRELVLEQIDGAAALSSARYFRSLPIALALWISTYASRQGPL
jgi:hypothetical protein